MNDKKIRRMLAVTGMAAVLAASALQGCGGGKDSGSDGAPGTQKLPRRPQRLRRPKPT